MFALNQEITEEQKEWINKYYDLANTLLAHLMTLSTSRRQSIAITKLEECEMFAIKALITGY